LARRAPCHQIDSLSRPNAGSQLFDPYLSNISNENPRVGMIERVGLRPLGIDFNRRYDAKARPFESKRQTSATGE